MAFSTLDDRACPCFAGILRFLCPESVKRVEQKQFDEALKIFNMAATVSNTDSDAYFWMGRCYEAINQKDKAIENYQRALALEPNFYEAETRLHNLQGS